jgi:predicted O-methyltransferase YrrM
MSKGIIKVSDELYKYILSVSLREPDILRRLREETEPYPHSFMQISPDQGQFMSLLIRLVGAARTIDVGVYTGYSSLCVALAIPDNGKLIACDVNEEWTSVAKKYWAEAGLSHKVDLRLAPAIETLDSLLAENLASSFDFIFIDADKENYDDYYEKSLKLLRTGGLIAVDNVLWSGRVLESVQYDPETSAIKAFNRKLLDDDRISLSMVPIADGLTLALKRPTKSTNLKL